MFSEKDIEKIVDRRLKQVLGKGALCVVGCDWEPDWDSICDRYQWVAQDADGNIYAYSELPACNATREWWESDAHPCICLRNAPKGTRVPHWKDTLVRRPKPKSELEIDWSQAPDWSKFAAMDEDGEWFWFEDKPVAGVSKFWVRSPVTSKALVVKPKPAYAPGGWRNSITLRPVDHRKPVVDWSTIPVWCDWVAMDENGRWYAYVVEPSIRSCISDRWTLSGDTESHNLVRIPPARCPSPNGLDWKRTLCRRPGRGQ